MEEADMKKTYSKPTVYAESFELMEHITSPCSPIGRATHQAADVCSYDANDANGALFIENNAACAYNPGDPALPADYWTGMELECKADNFQAGAKVFSS